MGRQSAESTVPDLLARVTRRLRDSIPCGTDQNISPDSFRQEESVLLAAAARYCPPNGAFLVTPPTGFDVEAGALYEAIVESAFLVANADGHFDSAERRAFGRVVIEASQNHVSLRQVDAIVSDLLVQLEQDGIRKRIVAISNAIGRRSDRQEALMIAALIAEVSGGVSDVERDVLEQLAAAFDISLTTLDEILITVQKSLLGQN